MKKLKWIMAVFALVLTASIVYAAAIEGTLNITGTSSMTDVTVVIEKGNIVENPNTSGLWTTQTSTSLGFLAYFSETSESIVFEFSVKKSGRHNVEVTAEIELGEGAGEYISVICELTTPIVFEDDEIHDFYFIVEWYGEENLANDFSCAITINWKVVNE